MANNIIIGLGGTGGKIIRSLRKMVDQMHRGQIPDHPRVTYFYMDSSAEHMRQDDPEWKVIGGKSVQLGLSDQLHISGMNLKEILDNTASWPGIQPWIGNKDDWRAILMAQQGAQLFAAQKRRLGRFLLAPKVNEFLNAARQKKSEVSEGNQNKVYFHICAGLAGGTGSGTVVDVVTQLRKEFPESERNRIFLYLLLPEENPHPAWRGPNYWPNGYAALTELNGLATGKYKPYDLTGKGGRLDIQDAFNGCYLFTDTNRLGYKIDVDKKVPEMVATFLYHKIYSAEKVGEQKWQLDRLENFEVVAQGKEDETGLPSYGDDMRSSRNNPARGPRGLPERSRRFLTFGVKQIAYPEEEIRDYLTHAFARQASLQLAFNNWEDGRGFLDEPRNISVSEFVRLPDNQVKWKISDEHLSLSVGILPVEAENKEWKPIENDWATILATFKADIRAHKADQKNAWLDELTKLCDKRFREGFRKMGAPQFYEGKIRDRADHAREILRAIEQDLYSQWNTNGKYGSLYDISRVLEGLISALEERYTAHAAKVDKLAKEIQVTEGRIKQQDAEWVKIGPLAEMTGKRERLFDARSLNMQNLYVTRTRKEALRFSTVLLKDLIQQVQVLRGSVDRALSLINSAAKHFLEQKESRCKDEKELDLNQQLVRFFDPQHVREVCRQMESDKDTQKAQTARLRAALTGLMGANPTFAKITQVLTEAQIREAMEAACKESVEDSHAKAVTEMRTQEPLFGVNVLDKIEKHFGSDEAALRQFVHDVTGKASVFLAPDQAEREKDVPGLNMIPDSKETWIDAYVVILPKSASPFLQKMSEEFRRACKVTMGEPSVVTRDDRLHEIVIINMAICFPLRTVASIRKLRQEYATLVKSSGRATLELHSEDPKDEIFPNLYLPTAREIGGQTLPYLLLGLGLEVIVEDLSDKKGRKLRFVTRDPDTGLEIATQDLKGDALESVEDLATEAMIKIRREVQRLMSDKKLDREGLKAKFVAAVQKEQKLVQSNFGPSSKENEELLAASKRALEILAG